MIFFISYSFQMQMIALIMTFVKEKKKRKVFIIFKTIFVQYLLFYEKKFRAVGMIRHFNFSIIYFDSL